MTDLRDEFPLVSVGLPIYNGEATITRAIESILRQDYPNIELVISDNGSTDKTYEILVNLYEQSPNIRIHRSLVNRGWTWNANRVFSLSHGEFFLWSAHDDFYEKSFISSAIQQLKLYPMAVMCHPKTKAVIDGGTESLWHSGLESFKGLTTVQQRYSETLNNFPAVAFYGVYRSRILREIGTLTEIVGADVVFIQKLSLYGNFCDTESELFTRIARPLWNTRKQNITSYLGYSRKLSRLSLRLEMFNQRALDIQNSPHSSLTKVHLVFIAATFEIRSIVVKYLVRLIVRATPKWFTRRVSIFLYMHFLQNSNVIPEDFDLYYSRIIAPSLTH